MPPILREIEQAAIGCWSLVRGKADGTQRFDLSISGFWRSFRWAFVLAPLDALDALYRHFEDQTGDDGNPAVSIVWVLAVNAIASLLTFFLFPLIAGALARPMGLSKRYPTYIIARNWLTVFLSLPVYFIDILSALGVLDSDLHELLTLGIIVVTLFAGTVYARLLLGTPQSLAFGFALLDFLLALLIVGMAFRLIA